MFWGGSQGGLVPIAVVNRSKADVLRGVVTDRLNTAVREILAVVERTVAEYEAEAAGFRQAIDGQRQQINGQRQQIDGQRQEIDRQRQEIDGQRQEIDQQRQEIDRQRQALGVLLESQVKTEPANVCPGEQQLCPVTAVKEEEVEEAGGAEKPVQDGHVWNDLQLCPESAPGATLRTEEENEEAGGKENPEQDQHVWSEQRVNQLHPERQDALAKTPENIEEEDEREGPLEMSYEEFVKLGLISYIEEDDDEGEALPPLRGSPKQKKNRRWPSPRSGTRTSLRLRMSGPKELIHLTMCILPDPHITEVSPSALWVYPTQEVSCPVELQQEDFLDLLHVTFPQINNKPFDLLQTDDSGKLLPLHVEMLTAEEIQRNLKDPYESVYIRLRGDAESNITAVSSRPVTTVPTKMRFVARSRARKRTHNGQGFIDLGIMIPEESEIEGQSLQVKSSKLVKVVRCPLGLKEEDFVSQLKSLFPQLAGDTIIELFHTNFGSDLVPLKAPKLTPEEIWKSISAEGPGSTLCVQQKTSTTADGAIAVHVSRPPHQDETQMDQTPCPESPDQQNTRAAAGVNKEEVSSPAHQDETQMDQTSCPENPDQQMKEKCPEVSVELMECSFTDVSESADELVVDTTSESEDGDVGLSLKPKQTPPLLNDPGSMSPPVCASTRLKHESNTITSEVPGAEEPCSSQDAMDTVVVAASQKKNGSRVYNKRHYCWYCSKPYGKMARHLEGAHSNESDVAKALSFPKCSSERRKQLDYIRKKGNYAHNAAVMESGKGELVACKRPSKESKGSNFVHCAYCQGLFIRPFLWKHMRGCYLRPASAILNKGKNRVQSMCTYKGPMPSHMSKQLWGVVSVMIQDPITEIIKSDHVITDLGQHLLNEGGMSAKNREYVRVKMRELGRLIHNARKVTALKNMVDFINPKNYLEMVKAVKKTCCFDSETNKFMIPSLAYKIGSALLKVSKLLKAQGLKSDNDELVRNATRFQEVHSKKWNELIPATAIRNIADTKWKVPALIPFTEDVQKLHQFLSQMQDECTSALSECPSAKALGDLTKVCLTQIILFNRHRERNVASMPLSAFLSRDTTDPHEDVDWALSKVEKQLCGQFSRIIIKRKLGRPVPLLLTPKMLSALELLAKHRETCGVLKDNIFMFARPAAMTHFRGTNCIQDFVEACGAKCPKSLTSIKLREHAATLSTVLNMADTDMSQLANFLRHDFKIHEFRQLPEKTLQLAKISKVLMALEEGRSAEFHGKNFDEITIEPDECVLETDEEDENGDEGNYSTSDDELAAEEKVILQQRRKYRIRAMKTASKVKTSRSRKPWVPREVKAVEKHMIKFIKSGIVPSKSDCVECLEAHPEALKNRDWKILKFYVSNRIVAYRRKTQFK